MGDIIRPKNKGEIKMTNKDKFLREDASVEELIEQMEEKMVNKYGRPFYKEDAKRFFEDEYQKTPPTLTEDERVILMNIKGQPKYISRQKGYGLMAYDKAKRETKTGWSYENGREMSSFSHLFKFIKERRRILNKRIIRRGDK